MNLRKRIVSLVLALLLCAVTVLPAAATEAGGTAQSSTTTQQKTSSGQSFTEVNETVYAIARVNVRKGPGTQHKTIAQLNYGYSVTRIGVGDQGWSMVLWEGDVAYIFTSYLSSTRPKGYNTEINDSDLLYQIAIANGLNRADYTQESWMVLTDALAEANKALNGNSQAAADDAEKVIRDAMSALVRMNYTELEKALAEVDALAASSEVTDLWYTLVNAAYAGRELLSSGNQAAVDATTEQIRAQLVLVQEALKELEAPHVVIQEVPVEIPQAKDYCGQPMHRVWPILFFISLAINVMLVVVMIIYVINKKKNQKDDTPLVDYDIFDDTF